MLGNKNRLVFQLIAQGEITGDTTENDVVGNHIRLPCRARLVDVDISAKTVASGGTTTIAVYSGVAVATGTEIAAGDLSNATPRADGTMVAAYADKLYDANQEFCLSEKGSAHATNGLCVVLTFREWEG